MDLKSMTLEELEECMVSLQEPKFRAKQLYEWMHRHLAFSWDEMGNLPKKLKEKLQQEIWKEEIRREAMLPVFYENGAEEEMDRRMILKSDVDAVLKAYEASGEAVEDPEKGWLAASARIGNVTFWVKFRETEKGYLVYGAYSHRMTVE